jgi:HAD superfamily hydrolase (TIGR01549 family)
VPRESGSGERPAAIVDVDGTLVDSVYHHALAWHRALRRFEVVVPIWRIHRHIGMGGDQIVAALGGDELECDRGDEVREAHDEEFAPLMKEVPALPGARELLAELERRGHTVILASSAKDEELEHYLDLLDAREIADGWTSSADVEATKPHPELVDVAREKAGGGPAVMIGDSTWDCEAAARAGLPSVGVRTGGFGAEELRRAGAAVVVESLEALREELDATPLR